MKTHPEGTLAGRFREMASRWRDRPAIRHGGAILSYGELDRKAGEFAARLSAFKEEAGPVVGLSLSSPVEAIAAMLGVLQTGCAYAMIDSRAPGPQKLAVAREMALTLVLGDSAGERWPGFAGHWLEASAPVPAHGRGDDLPNVSPSAPACIVQTSGTTGRPLGVEISHAALLHTITNYTELAALGPEDRFTMLTSPAHFAAHSAIFGALLNGACLCPFDVRKRGFAAMADWLDTERLTVYQSPPSLFRSLCRQLAPARKFPALRLLRLGGEVALASDLELFRRHFRPDAVFVNALGISEAAGNVAWFRFGPGAAIPGPVLPVGLPAPGREIFLADESGKPVPPGTTGEIVVRSEFLATGYYRQPELTARKFRSVGGRREFWTGDFGRFTPEGWLRHEGRKDDQVKIRGHRVDLAGLEAILRSIPGVREARVLSGELAQAADEPVAFVVPTDAEVTAGSIRRQLAEVIVSPVLPRVLLLPDFPLGAGGKLDRARLRQLAARRVASSCAPRSALEREIASIWRAVLRVDEIGVYDDFFACGGDSLKALQAAGDLEVRFRLRLGPGFFLDHATIAQMGEHLEARLRHRAARGWRSFFTRHRPGSVVALRPLQPDSPPPLFLCPGGWGHENELLVFAAMLPHLPPELPVYGLKQNFLGQGARPPRSVGAIARNFLGEIGRIYPRGPFHLLGECVAGVIVLELAHQLRRAAREAEKIILLDPRLPRSAPPPDNLPPAVSQKVRPYYRMLAETRLRPCRRDVDLISPTAPGALRQRLEPWHVFDFVRVNLVQVQGDHDTYLREHGREVAAAIARILTPGKKAAPETAGPLVAVAGHESP